MPFTQLNVSRPAAPASAPGGTWTLGAWALTLSVSRTTCIRQHPACHTLLRLCVPSHVCYQVRDLEAGAGSACSSLHPRGLAGMMRDQTREQTAKEGGRG